MLLQGILQTKVIILIGVTFLLRHMIPDHLLILKVAKESVCSSSCWKVFNLKPKFSYAIWWWCQILLPRGNTFLLLMYSPQLLKLSSWFSEKYSCLALKSRLPTYEVMRNNLPSFQLITQWKKKQPNKTWSANHLETPYALRKYKPVIAKLLIHVYTHTYIYIVKAS